MVEAEKVITLTDHVREDVVLKKKKKKDRQYHKFKKTGICIANLPSSRYRGLDEYKVRGTTANLIFSNCLPLILVLFESLSLVSRKTSPCWINH